MQQSNNYIKNKVFYWLKLFGEMVKLFLKIVLVLNNHYNARRYKNEENKEHHNRKTE